MSRKSRERMMTGRIAGRVGDEPHGPGFRQPGPLPREDDDDDWPGFTLTPDLAEAAQAFFEREIPKMGLGEIPPGFRRA